MIKSGITAAIVMLAMTIGCIVSCDEGPTGSEESGVAGIWTGGAGRQGGGGEGNLDSIGIELTINEDGTFTIVRGNKIWGSSLFGRDSTRESGTWVAEGDAITFTPDEDKCFRNSGCQDDPPPPDGWCQCKNNEPPNFCECNPPFTFIKNISDNVWHDAILENNKLVGKYDTMDLVKQ